MDRSILAARIQDILKGRSKPSGPQPAPINPENPGEGELGEERSCGASLEACDEEAAFAARCAADEAASASYDILGGKLHDGPAGRCLVVERRYGASHMHGRRCVGHYAAAAAAGLHSLPWFLGDGGAGSARGLLDPVLEPHLLFFDLETTGLSGGAGTYAFLIGCAAFDGRDLVTRQFFLRGYGEERALLEAVRAFVEAPANGAPSRIAIEPSADSCPPPVVLITYNGRAFDLPLIETRYLFHRRESPFSSLPHVDMLFSARRLWRRRPPRHVRSVLDRLASDASGDLRASCALTSLEQDILGLERYDDVPGWEIPARYFAYTRTGDARGLEAVLEHNRLDLLSLASISAVILAMVSEPATGMAGRYECLARARLFDYLERDEDAERCYELAAAADGLVEGEFDRVARAEALHWLALHHRRAKRFHEAAEAWRALLQVSGLDTNLRREACEALAIHHEHRAKDLDAARRFALHALDVARGGRFAPDVEHRLHRLARKIGRRPGDEIAMQPAFRLEDGGR